MYEVQLAQRRRAHSKAKSHSSQGRGNAAGSSPERMPSKEKQDLSKQSQEKDQPKKQPIRQCQSPIDTTESTSSSMVKAKRGHSTSTPDRQVNRSNPSAGLLPTRSTPLSRRSGSFPHERHEAARPKRLKPLKKGAGSRNTWRRR
jgi:hypothetical protein